MSYKFSKGSQVIGDLKAADDTQRDTLIDFGEDQIDLQTSGAVRLNVSNDGVYIPNTAQNASLFVSGGIEVTPGNQEGLRFMKSADELNFISFQDGTDGGSFNARMSYNSAEFLFIAPGRGADFFINSAENSGDTTFPFSIMDDGTARFEKGLTSTAARAADLASDISFYVSGTVDGNNNALFMGNVKLSGALLAEDNVIVDGRVGIGTDNPSYKLEVGGNMAVGQYIYHRNDTDTFINFTDNEIHLQAGGFPMIEFVSQSSTPHLITVNSGSNLVDFSIKHWAALAFAGTTFFADASHARVGIRTESPIAALDVSGSIAITNPINTPSAPAAGQGYLYTKTDGKLYWRSSTLTETDLTSGSAGGGGSSGPLVRQVNFPNSDLDLATDGINHDVYAVDCNGGNRTITLPSPGSAHRGKQITFIKNAGGNKLTITAGTNNIFDQGASLTNYEITSHLRNVTLVCLDYGWIVIAEA